MDLLEASVTFKLSNYWARVLRLAKSQQRAAQEQFKRFLLGLCLLAPGAEVSAHHPEGSLCPADHVDLGSSMDAIVVNPTTWEIYPDGAQLPVNTQLAVTGHTTAFGYCDAYSADVGRRFRLMPAIDSGACRPGEPGWL